MPRRCRGGPCARPGGGKPLPYIFIAAIVLLAGCKSKPAPLQLQDPFKLENGGRVETAAQWPGRRAEILKLLEREHYGSVPSPPTKIAASLLSEEEIFDGYALRRKVRLTMTGPKGTLSFTVGLTLPKETGPFPALVHIDHRPELHTCTIPQEIVARGYILAEFTPTDLCPDTPSGSGPARTAFGKGTWGTISCWAWGAARVLDHLLGLQQVDTKRIAVTGHSRSGKAALWAGALDTRFALTVPQGSGCGGAGSYRLRGPGSERLQDLSRNFPHWFRIQVPLPALALARLRARILVLYPY